jgi:predicted exporter
MAIGFGSAIISFTVDYGITYLLFLDRPYETHGLEATKEVWPLGLLAMLTTAVSFAFLTVTGFTALAQIGEFTAMGVLFTYIFVHVIYPVMFPTMPPARGESLLPLQRFANWVARTASKEKAYAAVGLAVVLLFFANPVFQVDLNAMSSVSKETLAAEKLLADVWGNLFSRIYVMVEGRDVRSYSRRGLPVIWTGCQDRNVLPLCHPDALGRNGQTFLPGGPSGAGGRRSSKALNQFVDLL